MIGYCTLPMHVLLDQKRHIFVIALNMPEKRSKSLPIMVDGTLRVEARLFYSRYLLLQQRMSDLEQQINEVQKRRDDEIFNSEGNTSEKDSKVSSMKLSKVFSQTNINAGRDIAGDSIRSVRRSSSTQSTSSTDDPPTAAVAPTTRSMKNAALKAKLQEDAAADAAVPWVKRPGKVKAILRRRSL